MNYLIFDIEATVDPSLPMPPPKEGKEPDFPKPPFWQVATIGVGMLSLPARRDDDFPKVARIGVIHGDCEEDMLRSFVKYVSDKRPTLVSYNGRGYDLPVIIARCLKYGIQFPYYFGSKDLRYRYSTAGHFDVADVLTEFGACWTSKLDVLTKLIGLPGKLGVDGSEVAHLIAAGELAKVQAYCKCDVAQTMGLFIRLQHIMGTIAHNSFPERAHNAAMESLLDYCAVDRDLVEIANLHTDRLFLKEPTSES
jgi:3'-5' exonuclease